mmetsp:Transcript_51571/g.84496  ORF Transcript_51571/g.84496 Transcript_51571/m.84496 type:complete len:279 (-) Transcript_51571:266-1102(-)
MGLPGVCDLMIAILPDAFQNVLGLTHIIRFPCQGYFVLLVLLGGVLRNLRDGHFDVQLTFEGLDRNALLANDIWEAGGVHLYALLLEVLESHRTVTLLYQLLDGHVSHFHCLLRAHNCKNLTVGVDVLHSRLLLDELDLGAFWSNDDSNLVLRHLDSGSVEVFVFRLFCLNALSGFSALRSHLGHKCGDLLLGRRLGWSHARHSVGGNHARDQFLLLSTLGLLLLHLLLLLLSLLRLLGKACGLLPFATSSIIDFKGLHHLDTLRSIILLLLLGSSGL